MRSAEIVAKRLVKNLDRAGFVVMKRRPEVGAAALGRASSARRIDGQARAGIRPIA